MWKPAFLLIHDDPLVEASAARELGSNISLAIVTVFQSFSYLGLFYCHARLLGKHRFSANSPSPALKRLGLTLDRHRLLWRVQLKRYPPRRLGSGSQYSLKSDTAIHPRYIFVCLHVGVS